MSMTISFMSANFVARELGFEMTGGWGQGDRATSEAFRPLDTFADRFGRLLQEVRGMGFDSMDLWTSHLSPSWATSDHFDIARDLLREHRLTVPSLGGWFGSNREEFAASCRIAKELDIPVLGGSTSLLEKDRDFALGLLRSEGLRLGIENHPEKDPDELLARIGDGEGDVLGATVDTGWFGTQGFDAALALEQLAEHLFHVHLKDVREVGSHDTCRFGEGVVPLEECVRKLQRIGYDGAVSVEHEPETFDPSEDCRAGREMLERWLAVAA